MKDIYELFNDIDIDIENIDEIYVDDLKKKRIKDNLKKEVRRKNNKKKIAVAGICACLVLSTIAVSGNYVIAKNIPILGDFIQNNLVSINQEFENYIEVVGVSKSCEGIDITFENAVADDNNLFLSFLVKNNNEEITNRNIHEALVIPTNLKVNGKDMLTGTGGIFEQIDSNTIRVLKNIDWNNGEYIPNNMNISIDIDKIFDKSGDWGVDFYLDKSQQDKNTVTEKINKKIKIDDRTINIKEAIITPLSVRISSEENKMEEHDRGLNFIAFDEYNNELRFLGGSISKNGILSKYNLDSRFYSTGDMSKVNILPVYLTCKETEYLETVKLDLNNTKEIEFKINDDVSVILRDYYVENGVLVVLKDVFIDGKFVEDSGNLFGASIYIKDKNGEIRKNTEGISKEVTDKIYSKYNNKGSLGIFKVDDLNSIEIGLSLNEEAKVLKDEAFTIDLNK